MHPRVIPSKSLGKPKLSIVLPTVGRPMALEDAIRSVVWQSFSDLELIVSDNSNGPLTKGIVDKYASDGRVRYIRPDHHMTMPDHWEFASQHAAGRYVLMLTDRQVMRPSALEVLTQAISNFSANDEVISWFDRMAYDELSGTLSNDEFTGVAELLDSKRFAQAFARFEVPSWRLPRGLNSCYRADVAERIRKEHGRLFFPVCPDYTSAYLLLAYTRNFVYLDQPLLTFGHGRLSTGSRSVMGALDPSLFEGRDPFGRVPMRLDTVVNCVINDLLVVQELVGDRLSMVRLDIEKYLLANYQEIIKKEWGGAAVNVSALYTQWWQYVNTLPQHQKDSIRERLSEINNGRSRRWGAIRNFANLIGIRSFLSVIRAKFRRIGKLVAGQPVYNDALDAAARTDSFLTVKRSTTVTREWLPL
jgi:hypothetical protein